MKYIIVILSALLMSCSASIEDYKNSQPEFDLPDYFNGQLVAWGIVQDYSNKVVRRFCVDLTASWQGKSGQLDETFYYADGEIQQRRWKLFISNSGEVTGTADDVIGQARGRSTGSAFNWQYRLKVAIDGSDYEFSMDDWMYLLDEQRLMNRTYMQKLGVTVAEISIFFDKSLPLKSCTGQDKSDPA
ncbi:DUF3833 domain-containing protein [Neptunicella sp. SCSIO 80796]|uniref:DUF3833 domain-containing protein n=1 Tax=Neptunicella plasticusilytica TaxID=3117012 RepID=UPI003A4DD505